MTRTEPELLHAFAESFARVDDLIWFNSDPLPKLLLDRIDQNDSNIIRWKPYKLIETRTGIDSLRRCGPLPTLFETFALEYAWLDVDLSTCRLFANRPAGNLAGLSDAMFADHFVNNTLLPLGLVRFALAPDGCYDPICFDVKRLASGDCPIVRLEHESILMHERVGDRETIFDSFRDLVLAVIELAETGTTTEP